MTQTPTSVLYNTRLLYFSVARNSMRRRRSLFFHLCTSQDKRPDTLEIVGDDRLIDIVPIRTIRAAVERGDAANPVEVDQALIVHRNKILEDARIAFAGYVR